jgi:hypothetical protein
VNTYKPAFVGVGLLQFPNVRPCPPLLIAILIVFVAEVTTFPKESSTATVGCPVNGVVAVALATPVGWVTKAIWLAGPGPVTEKAVLVAGTAASEGAVGFAVAVIVYCVAVVGGFLAGS